MRSLGFWETLCQVDQDHRRCAGMLQQVMTFNGPLTAELVQSALCFLQSRHPMLQCEVIERSDNFMLCSEKYQALSEPARFESVPLAVHDRLDETSWIAISDREIQKDFAVSEMGPRYAWRAHLVMGKEEHELLFLVSHAISDALSSATLMHDVIAYCGVHVDNPSRPLMDQSQKFLPAFETMLSGPPEVLEDYPVLDKTPKMAFEENVPFEERVPRHLYRCLDVALVMAFVQKCKAEGVSVNSGLSAAWLRAVYPKGTDYGNLITAFNLRNECQPPVGTDVFGGFVLVGFTEHHLKQRFWDLARDFGDQLKDDIELRRRNGFIPRVVDKSAMHQAAIDGQKAVDEQRQFMFRAGMSNIGRLPYEENHGPFKLKELYFGTTQNTGVFGIAVSIITVLGKLCLCFSFPTPLLKEPHAEEMVQEFVNQIKGVVGSE